MENLSDDNEQIIGYSSSITATLHPGMPGNVLGGWVISTVVEAATFSELAIVSELVPN